MKMRSVFLTILTLLSLVLPASSAVARSWELDPAQSSIFFSVDHIYAKVHASFREINATTAERMARARNLLSTASKAVSDADARQRDVDANVANKDFERRMRVVETAVSMKDDDNDDSSD